MKHQNLTGTVRLLVLCAALLTHNGASQAAVVLNGNAVFNVSTSNYTYTYSVTNTGATDELVIVSVPTFSVLGITNIFAPAGFSLTYDQVGGWVNFIEDGSIVTPQTFAPGSTVGNFSYNSSTAPGFVNFVAYDAIGTEFTGRTVSAVPEPAGALLCGLAAATTLTRRRRTTSH